MPDRIVLNTGPLIALVKAGALELGARLPFEFICPQQVRDELNAGEVAGLINIAPPWLHVLPLVAPPPALSRVALDVGEAAVIQLALEQDIGWVCMDDWKGRQAARAVGLNVTGTLGLLVKAKSLGLIPALRPLVDRLLSEGRWFDDALVNRVLREVGE